MSAQSHYTANKTALKVVAFAAAILLLFALL